MARAPEQPKVSLTARESERPQRLEIAGAVQGRIPYQEVWIPPTKTNPKGSA
jgi:hypothetical protein